MMKTDKISKDYYSTDYSPKESNTSMFIDDLYKNIVPIYRYDEKGVIISIEPYDKEIEGKISEYLPYFRGSYENKINFTEIILKSIQYIANCLAHDGQLILEKVMINEDGKDNLCLIRISGDKIEIKDNKVTQTISSDDGKYSQIIIPKDKCVIIDFPKKYGGTKGYLEFLHEFEEFGKETPYFKFSRTLFEHKQTDYNVIEHQRLHDLEFRIKSMPFQWTHRDFYSNNRLFSSYYGTRKRLLFRLTQIEFRDFIIDKLRDIISDFSKSKGKNIELVFKGLVTTSDVQKKITEWESGQLVIENINDVF